MGHFWKMGLTVISRFLKQHKRAVDCTGSSGSRFLQIAFRLACHTCSQGKDIVDNMVHRTHCLICKLYVLHARCHTQYLTLVLLPINALLRTSCGFCDHYRFYAVLDMLYIV